MWPGLVTTVAKKMKKNSLVLTLATVFAVFMNGAHAGPIELRDFGIHIDGTVTFPGDPLLAAVDSSGFDFLSGLGELSITLSGIGVHAVDFFVDHDLDESVNGFFNEVGLATGSASTGQSWEIDEPGFVFGDIFSNFLNSAFDNFSGVPAGSPEDVSMGLGWDFSLMGDETAFISFIIGATLPTSDFFLTQLDPDSGTSIFFSSTLDIRGVTTVPEPGTLWLLALGLISLRLTRIRLSGRSDSKRAQAAFAP